MNSLFWFGLGMLLLFVVQLHALIDGGRKIDTEEALDNYTMMACFMIFMAPVCGVSGLFSVLLWLAMPE